MQRLLAIAGMLGSVAAAAAADAQTCDLHDPLRRPFFGDLHVHSSYSFDAYAFDIRNDPLAAYAFAKGATVGLPPLDAAGEPTRQITLQRALDFAAVTDHAEFLGETSICTVPGGHEEYDSPFCAFYRDADPGQVLGTFGSLLAGASSERFAICGDDGSECLVEAASVWADIQAAAEAHYDRTPTCSFTTFNAYEWTGTPGGDHLHRNVIFRGQDVPGLPLSFLEAPAPELLWVALRQQCTNVGGDCDVLAIPHNINKSGGRSFDPLGSNGEPMTLAQALLRVGIEPLAEIVQHKGESECRPGFDTSDELCAFEKLAPSANESRLSYLRNVLREGLVLEQELGVNPFRLGFVGATDTHQGAPGSTREDDFEGHAGISDDTPEDLLKPGPVRNNPGGLTVLFAEENTREALFAAMQRRESYATTGTRPELRFFGGFDYPEGMCEEPGFVAQGYAGGVPMGGEIGPSTGAPPTFAVQALMDPQGTPLQRIQIVKGWVDKNGETHEQVFDVAGSERNGAGLDTASCAVSGDDFDRLCEVWEDPDFDRHRSAFYYARVLENPSCRWSTYLCNAAQIDCNGSVPEDFAACCDPTVPTAIQERAYSSPIWYRAPPPTVPLPAWSALGVAAGLVLLAARGSLRR